MKASNIIPKVSQESYDSAKPSGIILSHSPAIVNDIKEPSKKKVKFNDSPTSSNKIYNTESPIITKKELPLIPKVMKTIKVKPCSVSPIKFKINYGSLMLISSEKYRKCLEFLIKCEKINSGERVKFKQIVSMNCSNVDRKEFFTCFANNEVHKLLTLDKIKFQLHISRNYVNNFEKTIGDGRCMARYALFFIRYMYILTNAVECFF